MAAASGDKLLFAANWENRTARKIEMLNKVREIDHVQARHNQTLEERRARLASLLAAEQQEYERALAGKVETMDQRRERLASKALELRNRREEERSQLAAQKQEQAFQESCDVLRKELSKQAAIMVAHDRKSQLELNERKRQREKEEEAFFTEIEEMERLKKVQRAKQDMIRTAQMNAQLKKNLDTQMEAYNAAKDAAQQIKDEEERLYKQQVKLDIEMEQLKERQRRAQRIELAKNNREFNLSMRKVKEDAMRKEKEDDMRLLHELLTQIKEEDCKEKSRKVQARQEALNFMTSLREQMSEEAENEAEIERLWDLENDKEWAKREARWKKEQEGRDKLLREVFEERHLQLELLRQQLQHNKDNQAHEREKMMEEMEALTLIEKERNLQRRNMAVEERKEIQAQIDERERRRENEKREKRLERVAAEMAEEALQAKVAHVTTKAIARGSIRGPPPGGYKGPAAPFAMS